MAVAATKNFPPQNLGLAAANGIASQLQCMYAQFDITTAFANGNTLDLGYLPKGAVPVGGHFSAVDLDTGTETLDIDIGIAANGVDSADPDFFANSGVLSGDAVGSGDGTVVLTNAAQVRSFYGPFPVVQLGAKTKVQAVCNAAANATGTGKICVAVYYLTPGSQTS